MWDDRTGFRHVAGRALGGTVRDSFELLDRDGVTWDDALWLPDQQRTISVDDHLIGDQAANPLVDGLVPKLTEAAHQYVPDHRRHNNKDRTSRAPLTRIALSKPWRWAPPIRVFANYALTEVESESRAGPLGGWYGTGLVVACLGWCFPPCPSLGSHTPEEAEGGSYA